MDIALATLTSAVAQELNGVIEDTCYVLLNVIFQVVASVYHTFVLMIVVTVIGCTVDNMRYSIVFKSFCIFGDEISTQIEEAINDFRANALVKLVFILLTGSTSVVKVFIVELLWGNLHIIEAVRS